MDLRICGCIGHGFHLYARFWISHQVLDFAGSDTGTSPGTSGSSDMWVEAKLWNTGSRVSLPRLPFQRSPFWGTCLGECSVDRNWKSRRLISEVAMSISQPTSWLESPLACDRIWQPITRKSIGSSRRFTRFPSGVTHRTSAKNRRKLTGSCDQLTGCPKKLLLRTTTCANTPNG
jgi:hypothetical protein